MTSVLNARLGTAPAERRPLRCDDLAGLTPMAPRDRAPKPPAVPAVVPSAARAAPAPKQAWKLQKLGDDFDDLFAEFEEATAAKPTPGVAPTVEVSSEQIFA